MTLSSKERAELRAEAHHLTPLVHVGHQGLTDALFQTLEDALRTRELVKVALAKTTDVSAKDAAHRLGEQMSADVVQTIGRTVTLFRENPDIKRKSGDAPPWRK
jgi:RNA-binding protein